MYVFYQEFKYIMFYNDISKSAYMKFQNNNLFMNNGSNIRIYEILLKSAFEIYLQNYLTIGIIYDSNSSLTLFSHEH